MDLSRFINTRIEVERTGDNQAFALTQESVSPAVLIESGEDGIPREMTICAYSKVCKFVDRGGNICDVPLRTGRVLSNEPEAAKYEQIVVFDLIRAGQVPLHACPYTLDYGWVKPGPLVKPPTKDASGKPIAPPVACKGAPDGCEHMKELIERRRAEQVAFMEREEAKLQKHVMSEDAAKKFFKATTEGLGEIVGNAIAAAMDARQGARKGLQGKGEL